MNLVRLVAEEMPEDFERRQPEGFRPCEQFDTDDNYWLVAKSLSDALGERCKVDKASRGAIHVCLDEVCENVVHHADAALGGFAAAQGWPRSKKRQFEIGIVDLGVGIRTSLTKNPAYAAIDDDVAAIAKALEPHVSSTPERNAGIGLFVTSVLLAMNGGHLLVRSGTGAVTRGAVRTEERREIAMPGTVVSIRANMDRPLDLARVYRAIDRIAKQRAQADSNDANNPSDDLPSG